MFERLKKLAAGDSPRATRPAGATRLPLKASDTKSWWTTRYARSSGQTAVVRNLLQDERYYAVHREHRELLARNNNRIVAGTDDADRIAELQDLLDTISSLHSARA